MGEKPCNVLVMAVGSPLGQSIIKALALSRLDLKIYVADISELAAGLYFPNVHPVILPLVSHQDYFKFLSEFILTNKIKAIFPVLAIEHELFSKNTEFFKKNSIEILSSNLEVYRLCNDKYKSMMHLRSLGIMAPDTTLCSDDERLKIFLERNSFPIFLKPRAGASSADIFKVQNKDQLFGILGAFPRDYFVAQEFLDDERDFTAGVFISRDHSLQSTLIIERELKFGLSYRGTIFEDKDLSNYCLSVADAISSVYSINVQFKIVNGNPYAYEINPRLSSTTSVRAHFGFNEPDLMLHDILGELNSYTLKKRKGRFTRFWQEHYLEDE